MESGAMDDVVELLVRIPGADDEEAFTRVSMDREKYFQAHTPKMRNGGEADEGDQEGGGVGLHERDQASGRVIGERVR
jgi:hypothetical protein